MPPRRRGRGRGAPIHVTANPVAISLHSGGRHLPHRSPRYRVVHFVVPATDGSQIMSVDSHGLVAASRSGLGDGVVIPVGVDKDGNYYLTGYHLPGEPFESLDQLIHAAVVHFAAFSDDLLSCEQKKVGGKPVEELQHLHAEASSDMLCEEQQHVGGTASSQMISCDMLCEELVGQTASSEMLQEQDVSSLKDLLKPATSNGLSINTTFLSSVQSDAVAQDTIEVPPPPHCLSSSPIWVLNRYNWGYTFYIRIDSKNLFHTYPRVGGPFQSLQEAHSAIDCYLEEHRDKTMFMDQPGVSQVDIVVRRCLYWPDGTRKKRLESQPIDEKRDYKLQLVQAIVDKYNDYNQISGDGSYEVKDLVRFQTAKWASDHSSRVYYHINFTTKTKGADDSTCVIDDLFFAEVICKRGRGELVVSSFCTLKSTDNGHCYGCDVKHPNDVAAYTAGRVGPLGDTRHAAIVWTGYNESLEEEERRVRRMFEEPQGP